MSKYAPCSCGSGQKQKFCHPDILQDSRGGQVLAAYHKLDSLISQHYSKPGVAQPPCRVGCSSCCYHLFTITRTEFNILSRELRAWTSDDIRGLQAQTESQLKQIEDEFPGLYSRFTRDGIIDPFEFLTRPDSVGKPCPLLDVESGKCRVYSSRPFQCRAHGTSFLVKEEHKVCEHIPSNKENVKHAVDATHLTEESLEIPVIVRSGREIVRDLQLPIIFWLKRWFRQYDKTGKLEPIGEEKDFRMSRDQANRMIVQKFFGSQQ